ncbi:hypothetical protein KP509_26G032000 [Ceratopteris richardii]|uniref:Uncharacterized protein n=1 Tax=Ceratopteris richardii TaxID=49495 RepID=A0A8T2RJQ0_CERRI|nr:hypothetical protein KP509_26G032000 [Ceratopteris richardii]
MARGRMYTVVLSLLSLSIIMPSKVTLDVGAELQANIPESEGYALSGADVPPAVETRSIGEVAPHRWSEVQRSLAEWRADPTTQYLLLNGGDRGKRPTRALCYSKGRCFLKYLTCPARCPHRTSNGAHGSACFIDCTPSKCETTCQSRKPKCHGYGAVCYDPRFVGGDGVMFYFHGKANENFCLVSDTELHVNAHFIGTRPADRKRDYTWVNALGIMYGHHKLSISAKRLGAWNENEDRLSLFYDGEPIDLPVGESSTWQSFDGRVLIERTDLVNRASIVVAGLMSVDIQIVPITQNDNQIHRYHLNLEEDCFAHLETQFKFSNLSSTVDGVLGQTYRSDFENPVKIGVPMPVMGGEDKFFSSSLFANDCKANKFKIPTETLKLQNIRDISFECSSVHKDGGIICKR